MITISEKQMVFIVSAPSGAGKTTLCNRLLENDDGIVYSVSCTTRPAREGEVDGEAYHFLTTESFLSRKDNGDFLEWAEVHGAYYGTLKETVLHTLERGEDVLMDIDVQGAGQIRETLNSMNVRMVDVFITPPSIGDLKIRLQGRGKDSEAVIEKRLFNAQQEMDHWSEYNYLVVNEDLDAAYDMFRSILIAERCRILSAS